MPRINSGIHARNDCVEQHSPKRSLFHESNTTGFFTFSRPGPYRPMVTGGSGCCTTLKSRIDTLP